MKNITVAIVMGTRPEAIKLLPVYFQCLRSPLFQPVLISTGQHREMLKQVLDFFEVRPDYDLKVMAPNHTLASLTGKLFTALESTINTVSPHLIVVQGDTTSTWVAAMVGFYQRIPVIHVEAGLRSGDKYNPFPEEINRRQVSLLADVHFAPTSLATDRLLKEGAAAVYEVGNTVIDSLHHCLERIRTFPGKYETLLQSFAPDARIVLVTCHRRENFDKMQSIAASLQSLARAHPDLAFVVPLHLNPVVQKKLGSRLNDLPNLHAIDPLPYDSFIFLLSRAYLVMTDSGGLQEEAAACGVPMIVMREVTERSEAVEAGCALLAGTGEQSIVQAFESIHGDPRNYRAMQNAVNPFGDGKSSERIVKILEELYG